MSLIEILVVLLVVGVMLYLANQVPMAAWVKTTINALAALFVFLWLLQIFGLIGALPLKIR